MIATHFIDTNILLYASSNALADSPKKTIARQILTQPGIGFSAQVLQEFYDAATRKQRLGITHQEAATILLALQPFPVLPVSRELVLQAVKLKAKYHLSYWDAAILAAAKVLSCQILYSEDFNDGQNYGGIQAIDPFKNKINPD